MPAVPAVSVGMVLEETLMQHPHVVLVERPEVDLWMMCGVSHSLVSSFAPCEISVPAYVGLAPVRAVVAAQQLGTPGEADLSLCTFIPHS